MFVACGVWFGWAGVLGLDGCFVVAGLFGSVFCFALLQVFDWMIVWVWGLLFCLFWWFGVG